MIHVAIEPERPEMMIEAWLVSDIHKNYGI